MKFYQGLLPRIIWDPSKNTALLEFNETGEFETEDENLIKLLRGKGYLLDRDMVELERTGRLPHGGFEKVIEDGDLPSGRPAVEDESNVHRPKANVRPRQVPVTEQVDMAGVPQKEPKINIGYEEEALPKPKTRVKGSSPKKTKRTIKRRKNK
jgi:hypothetical protein